MYTSGSDLEGPNMAQAAIHCNFVATGRPTDDCYHRGQTTFSGFASANGVLESESFEKEYLLPLVTKLPLWRSSLLPLSIVGQTALGWRIGQRALHHAAASSRVCSLVGPPRLTFLWNTGEDLVSQQEKRSITATVDDDH